LRYQFAAGRLQVPFSAANVEVLNGGLTLASRSLYLAIAGVNTAGVNLLSDSVGAILIGAGQSLQVTFDSTTRLEGEFWDSFVLAASLTENPESFVQLAKLNLNTDAGERDILPLTLLLSRDSDFILSGAIATPLQLPISPVHGMLRAISSLEGRIFEYDENFARPANGTTILTAGVGRWLYKPGNYSVHVDSTLDGGGCNRPISLVAATDIRAPRYQPSGANGVKRIFWLNNTANAPVQAGLRVGFSVELDGVAQGDAFSGLLQTRFLGYANTATGVLRTEYASGEAFPFIGIERSYQNRKTDLLLVDDLQPGEAYAVEVYPRLLGSQINGGLPQNALIRVSPFLFSQQGSFAQVGGALGDWIYPQADRGWVVPQAGLQAIALKRSGMVQSYEFLMVGPTEVFGLLPNTAGQLIAVNGNGAIYRRPTVLDENERLRAIVSTAEGISAPSPWSAPFVLGAGQGLRVTCQYPSNGTSGVIRGNYPDPIAGMTVKAEFNPPLVGIYVRSGAQIRVFTGFAVLDGVQQVFDLVSWSEGEVLSSVPPATSDNFCLFEALSATAVGLGGGDFPQGLIEVAYAFEFDGSAISAISHSQNQGCIHVAAMTLAEIERNSQAWAATVLNSEITGLPRLQTVPMQTRRTLSGMPILFDPSSTRPHDDRFTWKPTWLGSSAPGRWQADWYQDYVGLKFLTVPPPTQAGEIVIFADSTGTLRQRMPNNGGILPLSGGAGAGGDIPTIPGLTALVERAAQDYHFVFVIERLSLFFFNPTSRWDDDGFEVIRPSFIDVGDPGRWEAYPSTLKRQTINAEMVLDVEVFYPKLIEASFVMDAEVSIFTPVEADVLLPLVIEVEQLPLTSFEVVLNLAVEVLNFVLNSISFWTLDAATWVDSISSNDFLATGTVDLVSASARLSHTSGAGTLFSNSAELVAPLGFVFSLDFYLGDAIDLLRIAQRVSASVPTQKEWEMTYQADGGFGFFRVKRYRKNPTSGLIELLDEVIDFEGLALNTWHTVSIAIDSGGTKVVLNSVVVPGSSYGKAFPIFVSDAVDMRLVLGSATATDSDFRVKNVSFSKYL